MTDWFARPVLHVTDVEASLRFYINRLGFTSPWRYQEDGRVHVAQVDRQGCALILADTWPEKIGKGLMFISLNVESQTREAAIAALVALCAELEVKGVPVKEGSWATGFWWSMIRTAISFSSTIQTRREQRAPGLRNATFWLPRLAESVHSKMSTTASIQRKGTASQGEPTGAQALYDSEVQRKG